MNSSDPGFKLINAKIVDLWISVKKFSTCIIRILHEYIPCIKVIKGKKYSF